MCVKEFYCRSLKIKLLANMYMYMKIQMVFFTTIPKPRGIPKQFTPVFLTILLQYSSKCLVHVHVIIVCVMYVLYLHMCMHCACIYICVHMRMY